ncbi:hypothetical protein LTR47_011312 [Exophiala xenobiotica]|nr:hypothetical protein LTR72_011224 [Exophiala xenobiotica]KAK5220257.1 hypothetical protein LTR47_011312 [Exophiala xenobiotica]KAK5244419.1 hypothetical protein LTS06_009998 [Exophiala xenobiotica]KAK5282447.1 hypothetical protein LTR40_003292 [Exophiala xenobiotica]KAK5285222.1 hypothetical protein LTR14_011132 [Exophiala xenobiotica]
MSTSATETQDHGTAPQQTYVPPENRERYQPRTRDENELHRQRTQLVSSVRPGPGIKANPGPLGLFGFATTTFVLGLYQCGAGLGIEAAYKGDMRAYSFALGIYLILWCFVTLIFLIGALRTNVAIVATFFFLALAFFFLSLAQFLATENPKHSVRLNKTGGAFAVICAATAFWAGIYGLYTKDKTFVTVEVFGLYKHQRHDVEDGQGPGQVNGGGEGAKSQAWKRVTRMGRR